MARFELSVDLNRVEGDLEIGLVVEDGVVVEARAVGTLYRGFEQILVGRAPRDAMVITPRVCGICGTSHLYAAVLALEHAWGVPVPANATRIRNLCLFAEGMQSDIRQTFLFFAPDFCQDRYRRHPLFDEVLAAFEPFRGRTYLETLAVTRQLVRIVAEFGGQWPHSSYMVPGGVTGRPEPRRLLASGSALDAAQAWYETRVIGAPLDDWLALDSADALFAWLEAPAHAGSALGLLSRFARSIDLHRRGVGTPHMLSFGAGCDPERWGPPYDAHLLRAGFLDGASGQIASLDQALINEHVRHSWFRPYAGGRHPWQGETIPDYRPGTDCYTWAKAPRYGDKVAQTGPLAELLIDGDALVGDLYAREGGNAWLRQFARVRRIGVELRQARHMLDELAEHLDEPHFLAPAAGAEKDGQGCGMVMAARGALGHWISIRDGLIEKYQIITPTAWNASPRDSSGQPGHWEQSLVGLKVADEDDTAEIAHIIRSHDPCLVCTVHFLETGGRLHFPL
jgi:uptake hydrogenase large subunit